MNHREANIVDHLIIKEFLNLNNLPSSDIEEKAYGFGIKTLYLLT